MRRTVWALAGSALWGVAPMAQAGDTLFGECRLGAWSSTRNLDGRGAGAQAQCLPHARWAWSGNGSAGVSLRLGAQDQGRADDTTAELREAWVETQAGAWTLRLGRQPIVWGRADRLNPTDHFSARDLTLRVPDDDEQRLGSDALRVGHELNPGLQLIGVLARFRANRLPQGSLPTHPVAAERPGRAQAGLKLEATGGAIDASLSWFDGHALSPVFQVQPRAGGAFVLQSGHERVRALGADLATSVGRWNLRAEAALLRLQPACSACALPRRQAQRLVLGADTDFGDSANLNVQWFGIARSPWQDAPAATGPGPGRMLALAQQRLNNEFARREQGLTLRLSDRAFNDRLRWELGLIVDLTGHSHLLRPRVSWAFSDRWRVSAGLDHFGGPAQSSFGSRWANRVAFAELAWVY